MNRADVPRYGSRISRDFHPDIDGTTTAMRAAVRVVHPGASLVAAIFTTSTVCGQLLPSVVGAERLTVDRAVTEALEHESRFACDTCADDGRRCATQSPRDSDPPGVEYWRRSPRSPRVMVFDDINGAGSPEFSVPVDVLLERAPSAQAARRSQRKSETSPRRGCWMP